MAASANITTFTETFVCQPVLSIQVNGLSTPHVAITDQLNNLKRVGSYNWNGTPRNPIIVVPGYPKRYVKWKPIQPYEKLNPDKEELVVDQNHLMMPNYPMEPIFQAVRICNESKNPEDVVKFQDIDIVTDRNNLRKLFAILSSTTGYHSLKSATKKQESTKCQIYVQCIGRLVCLIRCEEKDKETNKDRKYQNPTFGKSFYSKCTTAINSKTDGPLRHIVSYNIGNVKFLVNSEVDCAQFLTDEINGADVNTEPELQPGSTLSVIRYGNDVDYDTVELATCYYDDRFPKRFPIRVWPQMFFSGTKTLVLCWQHKGIVQSTDVETINFTTVQQENGGFPKDTMVRLHNLLVRIVDFVTKQDSDRMFAINWVSENPNLIEIFNVTDADRLCVPDGLKRFIERN